MGRAELSAADVARAPDAASAPHAHPISNARLRVAAAVALSVACGAIIAIPFRYYQ